MRTIRCKDCGKRYDYDKDDFCPKCGAYNPPADSGATQLERELLSRFETGQRNQTRAKEQARARQQQPRRTPPDTAGQGASPGSHPAYGGTPELRRQTHSSRIQGCAACEEPPRRGKAPLVIVVIVLVLVALFSVGGLLVSLVQEAYYDALFSLSEPAPEPSLPAAEGDVFHETWEYFPLSGAEASIEDSWWIPLEETSRYYQEGYDCLAVDVWITGGTQREDVYFDTPCILLPDGTALCLDDDPFLARALEQEYGVYAVSLRDCQWEDPLYGSFLFFVPQGEEDLTLRINEYAPGTDESEPPRAVHYIPLDSWL